MKLLVITAYALPSCYHYSYEVQAVIVNEDNEGDQEELDCLPVPDAQAAFEVARDFIQKYRDKADDVWERLPDYDF